MNYKYLILIVFFSLNCTEYEIIEDGYQKVTILPLTKKYLNLNVNLEWPDSQTLCLDNIRMSINQYKIYEGCGIIYCNKNNQAAQIDNNKKNITLFTRNGNTSMDLQMPIDCFCWSPNINKFAIALNDTIKIYHIENKYSSQLVRYYGLVESVIPEIKELKILKSKDYQGYIRQLIWSKDESTLTSCSSTGHIKIWDLNNKFETKSIHWLFGNAQAISCSPDGNMIALEDQGEIYICDAKDVNIIYSFNLRKAFATKFDILSTIWSPDNNKLAIITNTLDIIIIDFSNHSIEMHIVENEAYVLMAAWSPDSKTIAFKLSNNTVEIWQKRY